MRVLKLKCAQEAPEISLGPDVRVLLEFRGSDLAGLGWARVLLQPRLRPTSRA